PAVNSLLDTAPLRQFLDERLPIIRLVEHFSARRLRAVALSATSYQTGTAVNGGVSPYGAPSLSEIGGLLLNAVFLDSLDADVERAERINATLSAIPARERLRLAHPLRQIPLLVLRPSRDL